MDTIDTFDKETLVAMAEAMLLLPNRLPDGIEGELVTLRRMLEKAVQGVENAVPQPPAYGKVATPAATAADTSAADTSVADATEQEDNNILPLRADVAVAETERLIELSPRRDGDYVAVPRVVGSALDPVAQQGGHHA